MVVCGLLEIVINIGFGHAATNSLNTALNILGYSALHGGTDETGDTSWWDLFWENLHAKKNIFDGLIDKYNAFTDSPIIYSEFLKVMIEQYPNDYYIYTKRNHRDRYKSARVKSFQFKEDRLKSPKIWIKEQEEKQLYIESVLKKNLHLKVLEFNVNDEGHGWKEICGFLNKEIPNIDFPHENKNPHNKEVK